MNLKLKLYWLIFLFGLIPLGCNNLIIIEDNKKENFGVFSNVTKTIKNPEDLKEITKIMADSELVLLGEATHGTHEFYEYRRILTQNLIKEHDFKFIAVEGDWDSIYQINLYVKGKSNINNAQEILEKFDRWPRWMWANKEIEILAEWLKKYNENKKEKDMVGFYGFDVYGTEKSVAIVESYLDDVYDCIAPFKDDFSTYSSYLYTNNEPCTNEVETVYKQILNDLEIKELLGEKEYFNLLQNSYVVKNAEKHYRGMVVPSLSSWNKRVYHMYNTINNLVEFNEGKGIIWAHNTHVGDARATSMLHSGSVNMGQLFREEGKDVFILGFGTYQGSTLAGRSWGSEMQELDIPPAHNNSYEAVFEQAGMNITIITLNNLKTENLPKQLTSINNNRAIGVVYNPENEYPSNYVPTILSGRYDAFMFIRDTKPLNVFETV
jgi:erythromycin esterase